MIKLDPDEEDDMDDDTKPLKNQSLLNSSPVLNTSNSNGNTSVTLNDSAVMNNVHLNNVQINLTRVNLPPEFQSFVS